MKKFLAMSLIVLFGILSLGIVGCSGRDYGDKNGNVYRKLLGDKYFYAIDKNAVKDFDSFAYYIVENQSAGYPQEYYTNHKPVIQPSLLSIKEVYTKCGLRLYDRKTDKPLGYEFNYYPEIKISPPYRIITRKLPETEKTKK